MSQHKICILTSFPGVSAYSEGTVFYGWEQELLEECLLKSGISPQDVCFRAIYPKTPYERQISRVPPEELRSHEASLIDFLNHSHFNVVVPLGDYPMKFLTDKRGIDKWHLSPLYTDYPGQLRILKCIPTYHPDRVRKQWDRKLYMDMAFNRVAKEMHSRRYDRPKDQFLINPNYELTMSTLERLRSEPVLAVDIETSNSQINTVGFAWSPTQAIAISTDPDRLSDSKYYDMWKAISRLIESDQKKILQNNIYEYMYLAKYGLRLNGLYHDTMWAQKFLWPELKMGLDEVGRHYTSRPYWKEDGKNWNKITDWQNHYRYNCLDTTGTFEGHLGQKADLESRGLDKVFYGYVMKLAEPIQEMCSRGLLIDEPKILELRLELSTKLDNLIQALRASAGEEFNPRSNQQVKEFLRSKGYQIPKVRAGLLWKESTDQKSLKKLRLKHKKDPDIPNLLEFSTLAKAKSSYLDFTYDTDLRMRYMINGHGTETGRFSSTKDPWGKGMNAQTVPGGMKGINIKDLFIAPQGMTLLQVDLAQAESRFVAYDAPDLDLINMLEDPTQDVHKYVAAEIFQKPISEINKQERQLGKKSGHGANYSMKETTFVDSCLLEMDLVLKRAEAKNILESYHRLFPGIRLWQERIKSEVYKDRLLTTPLGRERYFYGRPDDDMFRQAYAYRPQSTIPDITNHLMLHLLDLRSQSLIDFNLLLQVHDSLLLECRHDQVRAIADICLDTTQWHPEIQLMGGELIIPTEVETGERWGKVQVYAKG